MNWFDSTYNDDDSDGDGMIAVAEAAFGTDPNVADTSVADHIDFGIYEYGYDFFGEWHTTAEVAYVQVVMPEPSFGLFSPYLTGGSFVLEMSYDLIDWVVVPLGYDRIEENEPLFNTGATRMRYETNTYLVQDPPFPIVPKRFFRFRYEPDAE